jgi:hypothetical protein
MATETHARQTVLLRAALAALLFLGAILLWRAGSRERQLAHAQRALVTFQHEEAARRFAALEDVGILDRLLGTLSTSTADVAASRAAARYWSDPELSVGGADPFLAANAAYRAALEPGGDWRTVVNRLDEVIGRYAEILRNDPGHRDAAFNFEFVVRYRAAISARQRDVPPAGADAPPVTIHGIEGTPRPGSGAKQFRLMVPMQPEERREAEEAGRHGRRIRKG